MSARPNQNDEAQKFLPDPTRDCPAPTEVPSEAAVRDALAVPDAEIRDELAACSDIPPSDILIRRRDRDVGPDTAHWEALLPHTATADADLTDWCDDTWCRIDVTTKVPNCPSDLTAAERVIVIRRDPPEWVTPNTPDDLDEDVYTCAECFDDPTDPLQHNPFTAKGTGFGAGNEYLILECTNCGMVGLTGADGAWRTGTVHVPWVHKLPPHLRA